MKKKYTFIFALAVIGILSCDKEEEAIVDCLGQSLFVDVHHTVSGENPKLVNFTASYNGDHTLDGSIKWNFGDGTSVQTVNGTSASHTYTTAGTYTAKATISLNGGKCSYDENETVVIE